jgi:hypothetical protein
MKNVGAEQPAVAPDRQSVGWLALFDGCCGNPIPGKLVVLNRGRFWTLSGREPIWFWRFQNGGKRVAAREESLHFSTHSYYELWDVRSSKRIADYQDEYGENGSDHEIPNGPAWVRALDAAEAKSR